MIEKIPTMSFRRITEDKNIKEVFATKARINEEYQIEVEDENNGSNSIISLNEVDRKSIVFQSLIKQPLNKWLKSSEAMVEISNVRKKNMLIISNIKKANKI